MDYKDCIKRIRETPYGDLATIAERTGLSLGALSKIHYGETGEPKFSTLDALARYFSRRKA